MSVLDFPDPNGARDPLIEKEQIKLRARCSRRVKEIIYGLPRWAQIILFSFYGWRYQRGIYRRLLLEALEAYHCDRLYGYVMKGDRLTLKMLVEDPQARKIYGFESLEGEVDYRGDINPKVGAALMVFRDRLIEDPDISTWLRDY